MVTLRPLDWLVYRPCIGPMPVCTSAHSPIDGTGCLAALGTKVWRGGCKSEECTVRPRALCRQYPFERPAGGVLQVPERLKEVCKFGGFAYPNNHRTALYSPAKGVQNHWFWRVFGTFCRGTKGTAGRPGARSPRGINAKQLPAAPQGRHLHTSIQN